MLFSEILIFKESFRSYPKILWASLVLSLVCAYFSIGYNNPDEHWQINEFAAYKLGIAPAKDMPWELARMSRQTIQPSMVYAAAKAMQYMGLYNPFFLAMAFRVISALLAFIATNLLVLQAKKWFVNEQIFVYCLLAANFLWFVPNVHVRFQGENWSAIFLAFGLYAFIKAT